MENYEDTEQTKTGNKIDNIYLKTLEIKDLISLNTCASIGQGYN